MNQTTLLLLNTAGLHCVHEGFWVMQQRSYLTHIQTTVSEGMQEPVWDYEDLMKPMKILFNILSMSNITAGIWPANAFTNSYAVPV